MSATPATGATPTSSARPAPMDPSEIHHRKPPKKAALLGVLAWIVGLLFALPVFWMLLTSFHKETDAAKNPPDVFAPLSLEGYQSFFAAGPWPALLNSLTASVISTTLVILLAFPAAYALSIRPVRKWTDVLFFFLSTKMLPHRRRHPAALPHRPEGSRARQHLVPHHPLHGDELADRHLDVALFPRRGAGGDARGRPGRRREPDSDAA